MKRSGFNADGLLKAASCMSNGSILERDYLFPNGIPGQFGLTLYLEFLHNPAAMGFNSLRTDIVIKSVLLVVSYFCYELENLCSRDESAGCA